MNQQNRYININQKLLHEINTLTGSTSGFQKDAKLLRITIPALLTYFLA